ncbi:MAG: type VI secretion system-associated protein TagF [Gammaproteobacteria bacterium]
MSPEPLALPGYYGKLPARGDFVTRNLPASFIGTWDGWLQDAITQSRLQLRERWLDCYLTSPSWRFLLSAGIGGASAFAGVMIPSVDRVGRYFPLAVATALEQNLNPLDLLTRGQPWFEQAEAVVLDALDDRLDLEAFAGRVQALGLPPTVTLRAGLSTAGAGNGWYCPLDKLENLGNIQSALVCHLMASRFPHCSLWWSHGSERIAPCLSICSGLPPPAHYAAFLAGQWSQWGWTEQSLNCTHSATAQPFEETK